MEILDSEYLSLKAQKIQIFRSMAEPIIGGPELVAPAEAPFRWCRGGKPADTFAAPLDLSAALIGEFGYFGPVIPHFGHLVAEGVHRFLQMPRELKLGRWLLVGGPHTHVRTFDDLPRWYRDILIYLGLFPDQIEILSSDSVIDCLHVGRQAAQLGVPASQAYLESLRTLSDWRFWGQGAKKSRNSKVYVSRSALVGQGNILGERYLEQFLFQDGYRIIRPENMSVREQLLTYLEADIIIFSEGSAIHTTELLGNNLKTIGIICRRSDSRHTFESVLKSRCEELFFLEHPFDVGTANTHLFNRRPLVERSQVVFDGRSIIEFLQLNGFTKSEHFNIQNYNEFIIEDLKRYIEVAASYKDLGHISSEERSHLVEKLDAFLRDGR